MYNLASIIEDNVRERPDKTAVVFEHVPGHLPLLREPREP